MPLLSARLVNSGRQAGPASGVILNMDSLVFPPLPLPLLRRIIIPTFPYCTLTDESTPPPKPTTIYLPPRTNRAASHHSLTATPLGLSEEVDDKVLVELHEARAERLSGVESRGRWFGYVREIG